MTTPILTVDVMSAVLHVVVCESVCVVSRTEPQRLCLVCVHLDALIKSTIIRMIKTAKEHFIRVCQVDFSGELTMGLLYTILGCLGYRERSGLSLIHI